jgi:hypothetical protein
MEFKDGKAVRERLFNVKIQMEDLPEDEKREQPKIAEDN